MPGCSGEPFGVARALPFHWPATKLDRDERRALGISELLQAGLTKKADGYSGTFSPAKPV